MTTLQAAFASLSSLKACFDNLPESHERQKAAALHLETLCRAKMKAVMAAIELSVIQSLAHRVSELEKFLGANDLTQALKKSVEDGKLAEIKSVPDSDGIATTRKLHVNANLALKTATIANDIFHAAPCAQIQLFSVEVDLFADVNM